MSVTEAGGSPKPRGQAATRAGSTSASRARTAPKTAATASKAGSATRNAGRGAGRNAGRGAGRSNGADPGTAAGAAPGAAGGDGPDQEFLQELTDAITSVTTKTHSMQLYEMMGLRARSKMRPYLFGVLSRVRELQPVRVSDVAQHMDYERSTVSRHVAELTSLGCVERMTHPDDGRVVILRLTPKGQRLIDRVYDAWLTSLAEITGPWSASDRRTFLRLLTRFDKSFTEYFDET
jgi:DNA-binding MarR family transcriptional regulator